MNENAPAVEAVWEEIERWYAAQGAAHLLLPPATDEQIASVEATLGVELPEQVKASLCRHNGSTDGGWPKGLLLSCDGILSETHVWRELLDDGSFDELKDFRSGGEALKPGWWNAGWVSLDADGAGNGSVLDLSPGPAGEIGQVIDMDHEVGPSGPIANDFAGYLREVAARLEEFSVTDGEHVEER
ncbi:SMI1/KNR4 family protein [Streptomyces sp. NPDC058301]|uniref:SMI1/KNR4 family protein n=1 Tax=Streptomyces sp. NPDC058301 TaxID=3346436 RepID=UPI0036E7CB6E